MKSTFKYSLQEVDKIAQKLFSLAGDRKIWTFTGDLGAGKTTLIQSLAKYLDSQDTVSSPTYTLVNEYVYPKGKIYHIDAYRLEDEEEAYHIGIEEIIHSYEYVWIEWPQKIEAFLPDSYVDIYIDIEGDYRSIEINLL